MMSDLKTYWWLALAVATAIAMPLILVHRC